MGAARLEEFNVQVAIWGYGASGLGDISATVADGACSPPSLSPPVQGLERELGVPLFHRIGRRVVLSEAGEELVGPARVVVRDLEAARSAVDDLRGVRSGRLDVVAMPSPGVEPLTSMIAAYALAHPAVTVSVDAAFTPEEVADAVRTGRAEIGVLGSEYPFRSAEVEVMHLEQQPLVLIVAPQADTFGDGHAIRREDLAGHRVVVAEAMPTPARKLPPAPAMNVSPHSGSRCRPTTSSRPFATCSATITPSIVTLAPGASQTVRYVHTAPVAGGEKAYRLRVEEIPAEVEPTESGVIYAIVMDFPWIWRAAGATPELSARWDGTDLLVKNSGNATAQLVGLTAGSTIKKGLLGYVLPGEEGRFKVGAKAATVSLVVNGEAMNLVAR